MTTSLHLHRMAEWKSVCDWSRVSTIVDLISGNRCVMSSARSGGDVPARTKRKFKDQEDTGTTPDEDTAADAAANEDQGH